MKIAEYIDSVNAVRREVVALLKRCATDEEFRYDTESGIDAGLYQLQLPMPPATTNEVCQKRIDEVHEWLREFTHHSFGGVPTPEWSLRAGELERAIQRLLPYSRPNFSRPRPPREWSIIFDGLSWDTIKRRIDAGTIRAEEVNSKSWKLAIDDLPAGYDDSVLRYRTAVK